jgi:hypothetical protein
MDSQKKTYNILIEPSGSLYTDLLDYALNDCKFFLLVASREMNQLGLSAYQVLRELSPYLKISIMTSEWPGTKLQ